MQVVFTGRYVLNSHFFMTTHKRTIIIAEPHAETRELYAHGLDPEFIVSLCATHEDLRKALAIPADALVLSLDLVPGLGLLREIKRAAPALPIIVLGELPENSQSRLIELGASAHLNPRFLKPRDIAFTLRQILTNF